MLRGDVKKLLVTGASGYIGQHICCAAANRWQILGLYKTRAMTLSGVGSRQVDLTQLDAVTALFNAFQPDAVLHAAAQSNLGQCQRFPENAHRINVVASEHLAKLCKAAGIPCVFTSTDIVFDGRRPPYRETDPVRPINVYGEQKAQAEAAMISAYERVVVCRLALVFGPHAGAPSQVRPDGPALAAGTPIRLFEDEFRTPLFVSQAVSGIFMAMSQPGGIFHLGGSERISRYAFGHKLATVLQYTNACILPCRQADVDLGAPRPPDVSLDIGKARALGFAPLPLDETLVQMAEIAQ